ncbi:glutaredoxin domain-containing protein [Ditylenchus destructor]|uniref:Glutaredoxin domain-containing protein n=1 Tax=Ditylenchus destructor TaxID=166010 RepID=A0AAD4R0Q1_9BILA|nr:glutaredoxin domain-containing protein [Ditylenchus destructor]
MSTVKDFVDNLIKTKKVVGISKSYCPFCHKAKAALAPFNLPADVLEWVEIDGRKDMDAIQDYMKDLTGGRSVPRVFIGGKFFGGGDDTAAAKANGTLEKALKEAGAF